MRYLGVCIFVLALALAIAISLQPVWALPAMSIPFLTVGTDVPMVFVNPQQAASLLVIETNTSHMVSTDTEALAISFPAQNTTFPVRHVFAPSIGQTTSQTFLADRTYTFADVTNIV